MFLVCTLLVIKLQVLSRPHCRVPKVSGLACLRRRFLLAKRGTTTLLTGLMTLCYSCTSCRCMVSWTCWRHQRPCIHHPQTTCGQQTGSRLLCP